MTPTLTFNKGEGEGCNKREGIREKTESFCKQLFFLHLGMNEIFSAFRISWGLQKTGWWPQSLSILLVTPFIKITIFFYSLEWTL